MICVPGGATYTKTCDNHRSFFVYMATIINTIQRDGKTIAVYDNGMERDVNAGRIVKPPDGTLITPERSTEMYRRRMELKRERIMVGAAKVLERSGDWETPNDLDVVEAIGEAVMENAVDPKSKKQIDAASFILREAGLSHVPNVQRENEPAPAGALIGTPETLLRLAELIERERSAAVDKARAVDADAK